MNDRFMDALMDVSSDCFYAINEGKVFYDNNEFVEGAISDDFPLLDDILYEYDHFLFGGKYDFERHEVFDEDTFELYLEYRDNIIKSYLEVAAERQDYINRPKAEIEARKREELMNLGYEVHHNDELYAVCDYECSANKLIEEIMFGEVDWIKDTIHRQNDLGEDMGEESSEIFENWKKKLEESTYVTGFGKTQRVKIVSDYQSMKEGVVTWKLM